MYHALHIAPLMRSVIVGLRVVNTEVVVIVVWFSWLCSQSIEVSYCAKCWVAPSSVLVIILKLIELCRYALNLIIQDGDDLLFVVYVISEARCLLAHGVDILKLSVKLSELAF